ncbi:MAG: hypothetical protein HOY71_10315, partial [Nonomuraea sp.]|nr:hypothetical protein [Nonomuraea sp.]
VEIFERGLAAERTAGLRAEEAATLYHLALTYHLAGDRDRAASVAAECLAISREIDFRVNVERALALLKELEKSA